MKIVEKLRRLWRALILRNLDQEARAVREQMKRALAELKAGRKP